MRMNGDMTISAALERAEEQMTIANLAKNAREAYRLELRRFFDNVGKDPREVVVADLRDWVIGRVESGLMPGSVTMTAAALRFPFRDALDRPDLVKGLRRQRIPRKLPRHMSMQEIERLTLAVTCICYWTANTLSCGAGLLTTSSLGDLCSRICNAAARQRRNMSNAKRREAEGRRLVDMTAVVGAKCRESNEVRAEVVEARDKVTLQGFIADHAAKDAKVYTDDHAAYPGMPFDHETVNHSAAECVRDMAHTNGIESFWAVLKRAHNGVYHKFSVKHLQRYVTDFAGRHNVRTKDTLSQMEFIVAGMVGKRLTYKALKADNGLSSGARKS